MRADRSKRCGLCRCTLTDAEAAVGSRCEACQGSHLVPEKTLLCDDREPGGHDTVSHMLLMQNGDPMHLASCLEWMGISEDGDGISDE